VHLPLKIVERADTVAPTEELIGHMGADETRATGNQDLLGHLCILLKRYAETDMTRDLKSVHRVFPLLQPHLQTPDRVYSRHKKSAARRTLQPTCPSYKAPV
jgi:hypothetical protein